MQFKECPFRIRLKSKSSEYSIFMPLLIHYQEEYYQFLTFSLNKICFNLSDSILYLFLRTKGRK